MYEENSKSKLQKELLNNALAYQKQGFAIIPLNNHKKPLIAYADKPPLTRDEIIDYWHKYPLANIGLLTRKFFVVDIDRPSDQHQQNGFTSLTMLIKEYGKDLFIPTLKAFSPSGGVHLYYLKPHNIELTQNIGIVPGVDIKANNNNFAVAPPSTNSKGQRYEWANNLKIAYPSEALIKFLTDKQNANNSANSPIYEHPYYGNYQFTTSKGAPKYWRMLVKGFGEQGTRNNNAHKFASYLVSRYIQLDGLQAYEVLKIANEHTSEPLASKELWQTLASALKEAKRG